MNDGVMFDSRDGFRTWLSENAGSSGGIWLVFGKNGVMKTLSAAEALEEALCFGWIDGRIKSIDSTRYMKYFSPRRKDSPWSEKNKKTVLGLLAGGLMAPSGIDAVNAAKSNGMWDAKAERPDPGEKINAFASLIAADVAAHENFMKAPLSYKKQVVGFYHEAKQEATRAKRLEKIVGALRENRRGMLY